MNSLKKLFQLLILTFCLASSAQDYPFEVSVVGNGEPLLLFPGFTCTSEVWGDTVDELSKTHECHLFTFAGFGGVAPIEMPWLSKLKDGIERYTRNKKLIKPDILGHSMGGTLALWLASKNPDGFGKLVIVDALPATGVLMMPNIKSEDMVYDNPYNQQMLDMKEDAFKTMAETMAKGMTLTEEKRPQLVKWMQEANRKTYVYGFTDLLKLDLRDQLSQIRSPVFILAATQPYGQEQVAKTYESQYANLKKYDIYFAEDSAHFIMYDRPQWFMEQVMKALKK